MNNKSITKVDHLNGDIVQNNNIQQTDSIDNNKQLSQFCLSSKESIISSLINITGKSQKQVKFIKSRNQIDQIMLKYGQCEDLKNNKNSYIDKQDKKQNNNDKISKNIKNITNIPQISLLQTQQLQVQHISKQLISIHNLIQNLKQSVYGISIQDSSLKLISTQSPYTLQLIKNIQKYQKRSVDFLRYKKEMLDQFKRLYQDVKGIRKFYENIDNKRQKVKNNIKQNKQQINNTDTRLSCHKPQQQLLQYQIKNKLLQHLIKLLKVKGIFCITQYISYITQLSPFISQQQIIQTLQKHKMSRLTNKIKTILNNKQQLKQNYQGVYKQWKIIHDEIQIINIHQIQRFDEKRKENMQKNIGKGLLQTSNNQISSNLKSNNSRNNSIISNNNKKNQNGILVIGGNNSGKTTLCLAMAGEKINKKVMKTYNNNHNAINITNYQPSCTQLQHTITPFSSEVSCNTRYPSLLQVPKKYTFPEQLFLIDTSGFNSYQNYSQIDIMNILYTYETIEQMKKLRIVIVIDKNMFINSKQYQHDLNGNINDSELCSDDDEENNSKIKFNKQDNHNNKSQQCKNKDKKQSNSLKGFKGLIKFIAKYFKDYDQVKQSVLFVMTTINNNQYNINNDNHAFDNKIMKIMCNKYLKKYKRQKQGNQYKFIKHLQQNIMYKKYIDFDPSTCEYHNNKDIIKNRSQLHPSSMNDQTQHLTKLDPLSLEQKTKFLYRNLLKKFPIHHQYQNDYINLKYSFKTQQKLRIKKYYIESMLKLSYNIEQNNRFNFEYYLDQLKFIQNRINKIYQPKSYQNLRKSRVQKKKLKKNKFDVLNYIDQVNQKIGEKFNQTIQIYLENGEKQRLEQILRLRDLYGKNKKDVIQDWKIKKEEDVDYHKYYMDSKEIKQIQESISSVTKQFNKIIEQKLANIHKNIIKALSEHNQLKNNQTINNNKQWYLNVFTFINSYFGQSSKQISSILQKITLIQSQIKHTFRQRVSQLNEQLQSYLIKDFNNRQTQQQYHKQSRIKLKHKVSLRLEQIKNNFSNSVRKFKNILFPTCLIKKIQQKIEEKKYQVKQIYSDKQLEMSNFKYVNQIMQKILNQQFEHVFLKFYQHQSNHKNFIDVEMFLEKLEIYARCFQNQNNQQINVIIKRLYKNTLQNVKRIIKQSSSNLIQTIKQQQNSFKNDQNSQNIHKNMKSHQIKQIIPIHIQYQKLSMYLSKINEVSQFELLKGQMKIEIKSFNLKLKQYFLNLQKYLEIYNQKLANIKKYDNKFTKQENKISKQVLGFIKQCIKSCIELQNQIILIINYFKKHQIYKQLIDHNNSNIKYIQSIITRHRKFSQTQKQSIRSACVSIVSQKKVYRKYLPLNLLIDYMIFQQLSIQKNFNNKQQIFDKSKLLDEIHLLNDYKYKILQKLMQYPYQIQGVYLDRIQTQQFSEYMDPQIVNKAMQMLIYFVQLKQLFDSIYDQQKENQDKKIIKVQEDQPIDFLLDNIQVLSKLLNTVIHMANQKYGLIKQALLQIIIDTETNYQIKSYLDISNLFRCLYRQLKGSQFNKQLHSLQNNIIQFVRKNLFNEICEFSNKCQSIIYQVSKNIDSVQMGQLQDIAQILTQPQSKHEFINLLKIQCIYFIEILKKLQTDQSLQITQTLSKLYQLQKKIQQSENQLTVQTQSQLKQLQNETKNEQNSLHKMIKLYENQISKITNHKTLQFKFVDYKRHQLISQINQFLQQKQIKKIQKGKILCEQLKSYVKFLKSMKIKMVVNLDGVEQGQAKNIQALEKIYQKSMTKSIAAKSITDITPSQMKQNIVYLDLMQNKRLDYEDNFNPTFKTTNFANNTADFCKIRKPALKQTLFEDKSNMTMNRLDKVYHTQYSKNNFHIQQRNFNKNKTNISKGSIQSSQNNSQKVLLSNQIINGNSKGNINNNDKQLSSIQENINLEQTKSKIKNSLENINKKKTSITIQTNALIQRLGLMNKQFRTDRFCEIQRLK